MQLTRLLSAVALSLFAALFMAALPVSVQDITAEDEDYVTTPTDLAELLGPDGLEGAAGESYLLMQLPGEGAQIIHLRTAIDDGLLSFSVSVSQAIGGVELVETETYVYSSEGEFLESSNISRSDEWVSSVRTVREDDSVRVIRKQEPGIGLVEEDEVFDYQPIDDVLPAAWMSIMFAYHIREGHEVFSGRMTDENISGWAMVDVFTVEDVGRETVEVGGREMEAHVMMVTTSTVLEGELPDNMRVEWDESERVMQMYVLADGSIVRMRMEADGMTMSAEAITAEEAEAFMQGGAENDTE